MFLWTVGYIAASMASTHWTPGVPHPWLTTKTVCRYYWMLPGVEGDNIAPGWETVLQRRVRPLICWKVVISFNLYQPTIHTIESKICPLSRWSGYMSCQSYSCHSGKETNSFLRKFLCYSVIVIFCCSTQISSPDSNQHVEGITGIHSKTHISTQCFQTLPWFNSNDGQPLVTDQGKNQAACICWRAHCNRLLPYILHSNSIYYDSANSRIWLFSLWSF